MNKLSFRVSEPDLSESEKMTERQTRLTHALPDLDCSALFQNTLEAEIVGKKNCENLIGSVEIPIGIAGPVLTEFDQKKEDLLLPLATTEGALVASISRGCKAINEAGGCRVVVKKIGISRAPVFRCRSTQDALDFVEWLNENIHIFTQHAEETSTHLKFLNHQSWIRGRYVYVRFVFDTDEAMGMNMITIALQHAWNAVKKQLPHVQLLSLSSNVCSDKKDSVINRLFGRGYWVQVETVIPQHIVQTVLKTTFNSLTEVHIAKNLIGSNLAGSFSQNMQIGNVVAAMFLATGQDMAHVTEGSQASTIVEPEKDALYIAVTLPNLNLGTVGGGTWLPAQSQARNLIRFGQKVSAQHLAGSIGVAALAAEISGLAALASDTLASAHQQLARDRK